MKGKLYIYIAAITTVVGGVLSFTTPQIVLAQEGAEVLEEILVTARRREESLMDTPVSITAFTADDLEALQVERIDQIAQHTPNVVFRPNAAASGSNNNAVVYIRGVGQSDFVPTTEPGVGIYVNDAYIAQVAGAVLNLVDIESVQVLRGPQGTLFGRNTIGGAVLVNSVKPHDEVGGKLDFIAGTDDWFEGKASMNLPISDTLFSRFNFLIRDRDGWVDMPNIPGSDGGGSDETVGGRVALRWLPTENLTIDLSANYTNDESDGTPGVLGAPVVFTSTVTPSGTTEAGDYNALTAPLLGGVPFTNEFFLGRDAYTSLAAEAEGSDQDVWGVNLTLDWNLGWGSVKSISHYRSLEGNDTRDDDHSPAFPLAVTSDIMDSESWSTEIQLSGQAFDGRLDWTGGVYYSEDDAVNINPVEFAFFGAVSGSIVEKNSVALFAQGTYAVTDQLSATVGLRYTEEQKDFIVDDRIQYVTRIINLFLIPPGPPPPGFFPAFLNLPPNAFKIVPNGLTEADHNELDPYVNISYQWNNNLLAYFSYSEGFKGGGFVQRIIPGAFVTSFDPEKVQVYELGFKLEGLDQRLRMTGAVFFNDYTDLQIVVERGGIAPVTENAGKAEIWGGELELSWLPIAGQDLRLTGGLGWLDAEYETLDPTQTTVTLDHEIPSTPDLQYNLSVSYTLPNSIFSGNLNFRLDYSWTDEYFMTAGNQVLQMQDSYGILNGAITWISESENWEVSLRGLNMTDELYLTAAQQDIKTQGFVAPMLGHDARFSGRISYRF